MSRACVRAFSPVAILLLAAGAAGAQPLQSLGEGEGLVDIVAWPGYIERGQTDPAYDWVTGFEQQSGCQVRVKTANTSDEMVALMNEGGFDLVTASGDASLRLIAGKRVQEINTALIPSWGTVDPRLQDAPWHTVDGKHYGVPYQWGSNVLMYNTEVFPEPPASWNVVFEQQTLPDGKSNQGRVQAFDGPIYIADAALYLMHHQPELGIKDPYELDRRAVPGGAEPAAPAARDRQPLLARRLRADRRLHQRGRGRELVLAVPGQPPALAEPADREHRAGRRAPPAGPTRRCCTPRRRIPTAPTSGWSGRFPPTCRVILRPGSARSRWCSRPASQSELLGAEGCATNGLGNFDKIHFWRTPVAQCASQPECVPYYRWVTDYIAVLGGR